jgi:hypothetical protein
LALHFASESTGPLRQAHSKRPAAKIPFAEGFAKNAAGHLRRGHTNQPLGL